MTSAMTDQIRNGQGFIAALDQSGGSTPKALKAYGVSEDAYANDDQMFDLIHEMRARIVNAPDFNGDKVIGAILFEMTMDREIGGKPSAKALWEDNGVVPFLKIDKGLEEEKDGVQMMKPIPNLDHLLERAAKGGIFGTKERSVIHAANEDGINAIVAQQFALGAQVYGHGLMPILEPEVNIKATDKAQIEEMVTQTILRHLDALPEGQQVMLKLTLPETPGQYQPFVDHPNCLKVVALSGGYDRDEANARLAQNPGVIASFSRALTEGLSAHQSDAEFNATLGRAIASIHAASVA
ncbi:fructose bisphosphate aldolase [Thalassorhabdomicrobium marinisediminis]|uniref:fructose-bisphosphate aldolase n=1 Tax=Thalassorhabdomicrobium marinisediminis TaxID=2170577 RepID=A0A2T7G0Y7_9RHOB|nr:fructose bisphosphate aldolase [Thalassorhabdomicrobium marinisediminis]PVA08072.1 fructose bisphosphate aldolase [Thalassorhabdomicrobium marinisediminis]